MKYSVYTIGHSTRELDQFINVLQHYHIKALIDVRIMPYSRRYPHFNTDRLAEALEKEAIEYHYLKDLGGLRSGKKGSLKTGYSISVHNGYPASVSVDNSPSLAHKHVYNIWLMGIENQSPHNSQEFNTIDLDPAPGQESNEELNLQDKTKETGDKQPQNLDQDELFIKFIQEAGEHKSQEAQKRAEMGPLPLAKEEDLSEASSQQKGIELEPARSEEVEKTSFAPKSQREKVPDDVKNILISPDSERNISESDAQAVQKTLESNVELGKKLVEEISTHMEASARVSDNEGVIDEINKAQSGNEQVMSLAKSRQKNFEKANKSMNFFTGFGRLTVLTQFFNKEQHKQYEARKKSNLPLIGQLKELDKKRDQMRDNIINFQGRQTQLEEVSASLADMTRESQGQEQTLQAVVTEGAQAYEAGLGNFQEWAIQINPEHEVETQAEQSHADLSAKQPENPAFANKHERVHMQEYYQLKANMESLNGNKQAELQATIARLMDSSSEKIGQTTERAREIGKEKISAAMNRVQLAGLNATMNAFKGLQKFQQIKGKALEIGDRGIEKMKQHPVATTAGVIGLFLVFQTMGNDEANSEQMAQNMMNVAEAAQSSGVAEAMDAAGNSGFIEGGFDQLSQVQIDNLPGADAGNKEYLAESINQISDGNWGFAENGDMLAEVDGQTYRFDDKAKVIFDIQTFPEVNQAQASGEVANMVSDSQPKNTMDINDQIKSAMKASGEAVNPENVNWENAADHIAEQSDNVADTNNGFEKGVDEEMDLHSKPSNENSRNQQASA